MKTYFAKNDRMFYLSRKKYSSKNENFCRARSTFSMISIKTSQTSDFLNNRHTSMFASENRNKFEKMKCDDELTTKKNEKKNEICNENAQSKSNIVEQISMTEKKNSTSISNESRAQKISII